MGTLEDLEQRVTAVEHRVSDIENGFSATLYKLHRGVVRSGLEQAKLLATAGKRPATEAEVDAALYDSAMDED